MEAKFGTLEKGIKVIGLNRDEIFQKNSRVHDFWEQKKEENVGDLKVESVEEKLRRHKSY